MRVLVPVFIVAIIAVVVLILVLSDRRNKRRRADITALEDRQLAYIRATSAISSEVNLQLQAGHADLNQIQLHLTQLELDLQALNKKNGTR